MPQLSIVSLGDSAAVVLPKDLLDSMGLRIGDTVDADMSDRQLILRPASDATRQRLLEELTREVFESRRDAYQRLA